jgi:hypothetical protein
LAPTYQRLARAYRFARRTIDNANIDPGAILDVYFDLHGKDPRCKKSSNADAELSKEGRSAESPVLDSAHRPCENEGSRWEIDGEEISVATMAT